MAAKRVVVCWEINCGIFHAESTASCTHFLSHIRASERRRYDCSPAGTFRRKQEVRTRVWLLLPSTIGILVVAERLLPASIDQTFS